MSDLECEFRRVLPEHLIASRDLAELALNQIGACLPEETKKAISEAGVLFRHTGTVLVPTLIISYGDRAILAEASHGALLSDFVEYLYLFTGVPRVMIVSPSNRVLLEFSEGRWIIWPCPL